jgi:hypothetical protein
VVRSANTLGMRQQAKFPLGPPGQVASIAGKKAGMKQGELKGILKELGYTEDQVSGYGAQQNIKILTRFFSGLQVLSSG